MKCYSFITVHKLCLNIIADTFFIEAISSYHYVFTLQISEAHTSSFLIRFFTTGARANKYFVRVFCRELLLGACVRELENDTNLSTMHSTNWCTFFESPTLYGFWIIKDFRAKFSEIPANLTTNIFKVYSDFTTFYIARLFSHISAACDDVIAYLLM